MNYILALDQGTTSSRTLVFNREGAVEAVAQQEYEQHFPRSGWVEHDPTDIWTSQRATAREALERAGLAADDVAAIGIANQRETTLLWDRATSEPVCPAIVWQDRRTAELCDQLKAAGREALFQKKTGLLLDPYFAGTKLHWMLEHVEGARKRAEAGDLAFGTVDSWLIWKLTDGREHVTDATNASRTLLYDIHEGQWDEELLSVLDVPRAVLPKVRSSSEVYAETNAFGASIPIAGIAGDQQAALFGQMCAEEGLAKSTYGTGAFVLLNTGTEAVPSENDLLTTIAVERDGRVEYALEGSIFTAGAVVQWLRDGLGLIDTAAEVEALARTVDDNGGVYLVPAFTGLGAPHWEPRARGLMAGLSRGTTAGHLARAALEGIAFQVADVLEAMEADSGIAPAELRVDGGAAANDLLMQFQADVLDVPVVRPRVTETTAQGAAFLAGLAVGVWKDQDEIKARWREDQRFEPAMPDEQVQALRDGWHHAVEQAKGWGRTEKEAS